MNEFGLMVREEESCCEVLNRRGLGRLWAPSGCSVKRELETAVRWEWGCCRDPSQRWVPGLRSGSQGSRSLWVQGSWQDRQPRWLCRV